MKKILFLLSLLTTLMAACNGQNRKTQNLGILNLVWNTINTEYFDSTFNGLNWQAEYDHYKPFIEASDNNDTLYHYLNQMLFKLNVSHLFALPPDYEDDDIGAPQLFLDGTVGIDLRLVNDAALVTSVGKNSSAFQAGIRPGYTLLEVNGKTINSIVAERMAEPVPPFNERNIRLLSTENIIRELYGTPNDTVDIRYLDAMNSEHHISLLLKERSIEKVSFIPDLPPMYASLEKRIINDNIAYIRFDVFLPVLLDTIIRSIETYHNIPNMIIDIRGNPGGDFNTRRTIAEQFVSERTLFWRYQRRNDVNEVFLNPAGEPYSGKLVILIDELSSSSSEEFAGAMKAIGRAAIIGQRTAGKVLTMEVVQLPDGGLFVYPNQQTRTSKNEVLEAVGVIPDIVVDWNKDDLLKGIDTQLEKAIEYLNK
ncbi:MAG: hypothetical protein GXO83_01730 [Chlorobi bacterium]|nr:hypothetical protein [Chlorobiota bacterium]